MKIEGYGYEWEAELKGGPADGCLDRVIKINDKEPPEFIIRLLDGEEIKRESLGEKLIEHLARNHLDENQKVAVYKLLEEPDKEEKCFYEYVETTIIKQYRIKYE
jgi:hypothetical protein